MAHSLLRLEALGGVKASLAQIDAAGFPNG
jgi:hypothetical protein